MAFAPLQHGIAKVVTVAGGNGIGVATNQLYYPSGLIVSDDGSIHVADTYNHRVMSSGDLAFLVAA